MVAFFGASTQSVANVRCRAGHPGARLAAHAGAAKSPTTRTRNAAANLILTLAKAPTIITEFSDDNEHAPTCVENEDCISMSRLLLTISLLLASSAGSFGGESVPPRRSDDLTKIRARLLERMMRGVGAEQVASLLKSQKDDGSWPDVNYADQTRSGWKTYAHLARLFDLACVFRQPGSAQTHDPKLRAAVLWGLDFWLRNDFQNPNWWWDEIGVPRVMSSLLLMMDEELSPAQLESGLKIVARAKISMTGQNLVWVTEVTAVRAILENDEELVRTAYQRIAQEISVSAGEGIQADFRFHQHGPCLYNHGYGSGFVVDCAHLATVVSGTSMAFSPATLRTLTCLVLDGSQWMARGSASDFGRRARNHASESGCKISEPGCSRFARSDRSAAGRAVALVARAAGRPAPPLQGNRHFWCSDFMTHQRKAYYASARMVSKRNYNTDGPANRRG